jgi:acetyl-CoA carboxylase carboxyltransferase component
LISFDGQKQYDVRDLLASVVDGNLIDEYKADYGKTIVTAYARIDGRAVGVVANQRLQVRTKKEGIQMGGVIYSDSADKAARFVMDCNQTSLPIIFFQDVTGFMVGRDSEESGIIRSGAKLVNAVSNSVGAKDHGGRRAVIRGWQLRNVRKGLRSAIYCCLGHCALRRYGRCAGVRHRFFDPRPRRERGDKKNDTRRTRELRAKVKQSYEEQTDIRYGAARGWVDAIIQPTGDSGRSRRIAAIRLASRCPKGAFPSRRHPV